MPIDYTQEPPLITGNLNAQTYYVTANPPAVIAPRMDVPGLYVPGTNPTSGLAWGSNTLAAAKAGSAVAAVHADSIGHGMYASSLRTTSWVGLLQAALNTKWGDGGSGFFGTMNTSLVLTAASVPGGAITAYATANDLWTLGGGTWVGAQGGVGWQIIQSSAGIGDTATTPTGAVRGRYIDIVTNNVAGFTYTVDGGSLQTVSGLTTSAFSVTTFDCGAGNTGNHVVVVTTNTAATKLCGVYGRNTTGFRVDKYGTYGAKTAGLTNATIGSLGSGSISGGASSGIAAHKANLLVYSLYANDVNQAVSPDTSMQQIVADLNGFSTSLHTGTTVYPDILFVLPHIGKFDASASNHGNLKARIASLCRAEGYAYVDLGALGRNSWDWMNAQAYWGNSGAIGTAGADNIHLSDAGSAWMQTQVARAFQLAGLL